VQDAIIAMLTKRDQWKARAEKAEAIISELMGIVPFGNIKTHTVENLPERVKDFLAELAELTARDDRSLDWQERAEKAEAEADSMQSQFERLRHERAIALNVKTKEGLTCSEWLLRTGLAEERAEKAEAELAKRERALEQAIDALPQMWQAATLPGAPSSELMDWLKHKRPDRVFGIGQAPQ
jgi:hypothetical protein